MTQTTSFLSLTKPGGGSTGLILPPDRVDIDVLNDNSQKIDDWAATWGLASARTKNLRGVAASRPSSGMSIGDTYQETDGSQIIWRYDGSNWKPFGTVTLIWHGSAPNNLNHPTSNVFITWGASGAAYSEGFDQFNLHDPVTNPTRITIPWAGIVEASQRFLWVANTAGTRTMQVQLNGANVAGLAPQWNTVDNTGGAFSQSGIFGVAAGDYIEFASRQSSGGALVQSFGSCSLKLLQPL